MDDRCPAKRCVATEEAVDDPEEPEVLRQVLRDGSPTLRARQPNHINFSPAVRSRLSHSIGETDDCGRRKFRGDECLAPNARVLRERGIRNVDDSSGGQPGLGVGVVGKCGP